MKCNDFMITEGALVPNRIPNKSLFGGAQLHS